MAVGQREIARLWNVSERTAKREMAAMKARGWIIVRQHPARGRVTEHGLDLVRVPADTEAVWPAVGPDFVARMPSRRPRPRATSCRSAARGRRRQRTARSGRRPRRFCGGRTRRMHAAWFARLVEAGRVGGCLTLSAPSGFVASYVSANLADRLRDAVAAADPTVRAVKVVAG